MAKKRWGSTLAFWIEVVCVLLIMALFYTFYLKRPENSAERDLSAVRVLPSVETASLRHMYYQLDENQQEAYRKLEQAVSNGELTVEHWITQDSFDKAWCAFLYDHPEFFWLTGSYSYYRNVLGNHIAVDLKAYEYWKYTDDPSEYIRKFNRAVEEITAGTEKYTTDYEKVKFIHDKLALSIVYDHEVRPKINSSNRDAATEQALSAYGALINGKTLCGGYAESFYLLCNAAGVDCLYLEGTAGEPHGWNCVKVDGEYYYVDVTWDDLDLHGGSGPNCPEGIGYHYYCITSEEIGRTHTPRELFAVPVATATDCNYHRREGYYFEEYDKDKIAAAIEKQKDLQVITLKFADEQTLAKAKQELLINNGWQKIPCLAGKKNLIYGTNKNQYVLSIYQEAA